MTGLLTINDNGDTFYVGPIAEALTLLREEDTSVRTVQRTDGTWLAVSSWSADLTLSDDPDELFGLADEWGSGATEDEALRYMLGANFGPLDESYDDSALREGLGL